MRRRRRGSVYILIIGVSMLAAAITIAAALAGRVQARAVNGSNNASEARAYAQSAIDLGRLYIAQDSSWRTTRSNGTWFTGMSIGSGSMQLDVTNPAGSLNRFNADSILMTGTGTCGTSVQKLQVAITPTIKPYTCLPTAMMANGTIMLGAATLSPANVLISSNRFFQNAPGAYVYSNVETPGTIGTGHFFGTTTAGAALRTVPSSNVFDYYTANGTTISLGSLPYWSGSRSLSFGLISPYVNTMGGGTDPNGIYVIDCQNQQFTIGNCRICGTIVLLNCGGLTVKGSLNWTPAVSTLPCLLLQGNVNFNVDSSNLSELGLGLNLNPTGAPYPWATGSSNSLPIDSYPSAIRGLMYVSGNVTFSDDLSLGMLIANGWINCGPGNRITFTYNSDYANNPPPGFYDVDMTPASTTYTQLTN